MNLQDRMKDSLKKAMFEKDEIKKNILRVALGEVGQLQMSKQQGTKPVSDEQVAKILRKLYQSNLETLENTPPGDRRQMLEAENIILDSLTPKLLTQDQIREKLQGLELPPGKAAMGVAMKLFKEQGDSVDGNDVKAVLESMVNV